MWMYQNDHEGRPRFARVSRTVASRSRRFRPRLEGLEVRTVPSTLTVTNNLDSGAGSLTAAVTYAHDGDTIAFAPDLAGQTFALTSDQITIKNSVDI